MCVFGHFIGNLNKNHCFICSIRRFALSMGKLRWERVSWLVSKYFIKFVHVHWQWCSYSWIWMFTHTICRITWKTSISSGSNIYEREKNCTQIFCKRIHWTKYIVALVYSKHPVEQIWIACSYYVLSKPKHKNKTTNKRQHSESVRIEQIK